MRRLKLKSKRNNNTVKRDVLKAQIARYLTKGLDLKETCKLLDLPDTKLNSLRGDFEFDDFVLKCIAQNEVNHLDVIETAGKAGYWQASAWYLERKFPNKYGKRDILRHEYDIKLSTFQNIVVGILDKIDPKLKFQVLSELRNYKFDGTEVMNRNKYIEDKFIPPVDTNGD
jgi:hypothetical protein